MTRVQDMIAAARLEAYGSLSDQLTFLDQPTAEGDAELVLVHDVENISRGMVLSSGLNVYYVIGTVPAERKVLVYPNLDGSRNDALPQGSPVLIRPKVTDWSLFGRLNQGIARMNSPEAGLWNEGSWSSAVDTAYQTYPVQPVDGTTFNGLVRVDVLDPSTPDRWIPLDRLMWELDWQSQTVRLKRQIMSSSTVRFVYKSEFKLAESLTDDAVADLLLYPSMTDIPGLAAVASVLRTTEAARNQIHAQTSSRRASEVAATSNARTSQFYENLFAQRCSDEHSRLIARNPYRRSV